MPSSESTVISSRRHGSSGDPLTSALREAVHVHPLSTPMPTPGSKPGFARGYHYPDRPLLIEAAPDMRRNLDPDRHGHLVERLEVDDIMALVESAGCPRGGRRPGGS